MTKAEIQSIMATLFILERNIYLLREAIQSNREIKTLDEFNRRVNEVEELARRFKTEYDA